jgi:hypothetical protein
MTPRSDAEIGGILQKRRWLNLEAGM